MKLIPYGKQYIDQDDIRSVSKVLKMKKLLQEKRLLILKKNFSISKM